MNNASKPYPNAKTIVQQGFTLIELVIVLVILGILATTALPKFVNMSQDARIKLINSTNASVKTAAKIANAACFATVGCPGSVGGAVLVKGPDGVMGGMYYSYPTGMSRLPTYFGIKDWVNVSGGITAYELSPSVTEFRLDAAPDPTNCKVTYTEVSASVVSTTSGC